MLTEIDAKPRRPADAVANDFFRARRFIGSGDRRAVSDRAWRVLRARRRLGWWIERAQGAATPRMLVAASLLLEGWTAAGVRQSYSGGQYGPAPLLRPEADAAAALEGRTLHHPDMPQPVRLEVPDWVLPHLQARFGEALEAEMAAAMEEAPLDLRVNLLKSTREDAKAALAVEGLETTPTPLSPLGPAHRGPPRRHLRAGVPVGTGGDPGRRQPACRRPGGRGPDMRVVDWCAGAGGKTLALAMLMGNHGTLVACDVSAPRLDGAVRRLRRAGVHNAERHLVEPGDKWAKRRAGSFDRVLVDAPCTGTGTWRRNPDARGCACGSWICEELQPKQAGILDGAARLVRPGGRLIYATCSVLNAGKRGPGGRPSCSARLASALLPLDQAWALPSAAAQRQGPYLQLTPLQPPHRRLLRRRAGAAFRMIEVRRAGPGRCCGHCRRACRPPGEAPMPASCPQAYLAAAVRAPPGRAATNAGIEAGHPAYVAIEDRSRSSATSPPASARAALGRWRDRDAVRAG